MRRRNLNTALRRKPQADPMGTFDALPPALRRWLSQACLPWSPRSARRLWLRALARQGGDTTAALASLDRAERAALSRDQPRIWGGAHPGSGPAPDGQVR